MADLVEGCQLPLQRGARGLHALGADLHRLLAGGQHRLRGFGKTRRALAQAAEILGRAFGQAGDGGEAAAMHAGLGDAAAHAAELRLLAGDEQALHADAQIVHRAVDGHHPLARILLRVALQIVGQAAADQFEDHVVFAGLAEQAAIAGLDQLGPLLRQRLQRGAVGDGGGAQRRQPLGHGGVALGADPLGEFAQPLIEVGTACGRAPAPGPRHPG